VGIIAERFHLRRDISVQHGVGEHPK
jgi:hypothetical protein